MSDDEESGNVVRCRGLPWSTTAEEIESFFSDCTLAEGTDSVHLTLTREGRPSGEAYIEMASSEDVEKALKKDRQHMGKRYVEVFRAKASEMEWVIKRTGQSGSGGSSTEGGRGGGDNVVRLRGLPFECTKSDITNFFDGMEITNNGILLTTDYQGRSTGEAYVQFASKEHAEQALEKNKQSIGHRYIEVFRSSMMEAQRNQMGGGGYRGGRGGGGRDYGGGYGNGYGGGMMRGGGGRPSPYDRGSGGGGGPPMGRGYGNFGPSSRGSRSFKSFGGNDGGYGNSGGGSGGGGGFGGGFGGGYGGSGGGGGGSGGGSGFGMGGGGGGFGMGGGGGSGFRDGGLGAGNLGGGGGGGRRHVVHMRGLPFRVTENDIAEWFSSVVDPMDISITFNNQGRPTGEADVMFSSEADARKAMSKDRQNMQHRYIELFYEGTSGGGGGGGGGGNSGVSSLMGGQRTSLLGGGGGGGYGGGGQMRGFSSSLSGGNGYGSF